MRKRKILELQFNRGLPLRENIVLTIDDLGNKLDHVRQVRQHVKKDTWADNFWYQVERQLLRKIQHLAH
jgi:hypothetical protein